MPAWYIAMWVNAPTPVTSPTAHSRSPARIRSSTSSARAAGSRPTVSSPISPTRARRPTLTSSSARAHRRTVLEPYDDLVALALAGHVHRLGAGAHRDAVLGAARRPRPRRPPAPPAGAGRRVPRRRSPPSRSGRTSGPARRRSRRRRGRRATPAPARPRSPPGWSSTGCRARPSIGGTTGADPVADHDTARGDEGVVADDHPARARPAGPSRGPAGRPCPRTGRRRPGRPSCRWPRPGSACATNGQVRLDRAAAGVGVGPTGLGDQRRAADHHLARHAAPVGALAADQLALDADDGEARLGQPAGDLLATRPHPDHHDVDVRVRHGPILPRWVACRL